jgi:hypothetical protein
MTFELVHHDNSSTSSSEAASGGGDRDNVLGLPLRSFGGHYRPATALTGASALRWLPLAAAASTVRALLRASHEDLRLRSQQLSRALGGAFFDRDAATAEGPFFVSASGRRSRFPEDGLYVCPELQPLWPALMAVQRALLQVVLKEASHGPCDWYYDCVGELMRLLVGDDASGRGPAVFDRERFETAFALEWVE